MPRAKKNFPIISVLCFLIFAMIFILASIALLQNKTAERQEQSGFEQLSRLAKEEVPEQDSDRQAATDASASAAIEKPTVLPQYRKLKELNNELYGWISIEDTMIDYPVMLTPDEPEKYLHLDFNGDYSFSGVPFADAGTSKDSVNTLIYGHHMQNGSMFAGLMNYANIDYCKEHSIIKFDTVYQKGEYQVIAAFYSRIYYSPSDTDFLYYDYADITTEKDFDEYVAQCKEASIYDTGVDAKWGDKLVTLSTCAYHVSNGRFVVVAKG